MMIHWVHGINFRQHVDSRIEFGTGITAILGNNGCGKSTALEMISFSMFGEQRSDKDSIRFMFGESKKFSVTTQFEFDNSIYQVYRSESTAWLKNVGGGCERLLATSLSEVTKAVEKLLGLTLDEFTNSYWVKQKEMGFFKFKSPTETQKKVSKMLGYDRVQVAEDSARERTKQAKLRVEALTTVMGDLVALKADVSVKESELLGISEEVKTNAAAKAAADARRPLIVARAEKATAYVTLTGKINEFTSSINALSDAKSTAAAELDAATTDDNHRKQIESEAGAYPGLKSELAALQTAKAQVEKRRTISAGIAEEEGRLRGYEAELQANKVVDTEALLAELARHRNASDTYSKALNEASTAWTADKSAAASAVAVAESELRTAAAALAAAQKKVDAGICPGCDQPLSDSSSHLVDELIEQEQVKRVAAEEARAAALVPEPRQIEEYRKLLTKSQADAKAIDTSISEAQAAAAARTRIEGQIQLRKQALINYRDQLSTLATEYDAVKESKLAAEVARAEPIHAKHQSLSGSEVRLRRAVEAHALAASKLDDAIAAKANLLEERKQLGFESGDDARAAATDLVALNIETATLTTAADGLLRQKTAAESALTTAKARVEEYRVREVELKAAQSEKSLYETLASEMKALRIQLNTSLRPDLAERASRILSLLTNCRYNVIELSENFTPILIDDGVAKTVLSGGEEDSTDLALHLGLSEMIQERKGVPMSLLILDEIFGSLDTERRQASLDCLVGLKTLYPQIILISHIEGTSELADRCIYLRRDPETRATVVGDGPDEFSEAA